MKRHLGAPSELGTQSGTKRQRKGAIPADVAGLVDEALFNLWKAWRLYCGLPSPQLPAEAPPRATPPEPPPLPPSPATSTAPGPGKPDDPVEHLPQELWTPKRVREITSLSASEIHRRRLAGTFPNPQHIGDRRVGYRAGDILAWLDDPKGWKPERSTRD